MAPQADVSGVAELWENDIVARTRVRQHGCLILGKTGDEVPQIKQQEVAFNGAVLAPLLRCMSEAPRDRFGNYSTMSIVDPTS